MGKYVSIDAINVANEISLLVEMYPELQDDEDLRSDMLEGNTSLHDVLSRIVAIERDANSMVLAIGERAKELAVRKDRYARRKDAMRALLLRLLKAADLTKVSLPEATVSVGKGRAGVEIVDEAAVPPRFLKVVKSPDKTLIKEALDAGKTVKGAVLREGQPTLTVRAA